MKNESNRMLFIYKFNEFGIVTGVYVELMSYSASPSNSKYSSDCMSRIV